MPEWLCLILQKAGNGLERVAPLKFDGKRMLCQRDACHFLICLQGGSRDSCEVRHPNSICIYLFANEVGGYNRQIEHPKSCDYVYLNKERRFVPSPLQ